VPDGLYVKGDAICERGAEVAHVGDVPLPGRHNLANALAALTMVRAAGLDWPACLEGLRGFKGVEHRIEHVLNFEGADYVNDSKSTNIDSLRVALESFDRPIVLIAGGRGKGADYRVLREIVSRRVKALVAIGEDGPKLVQTFGDLVPSELAHSLDDAVHKARAHAVPGDVVLLSPGCASFDWFRNFEERGRSFKQAVQRLSGRQRLAAGA
jgi:UDP-N-acetylmuramoylalanine--D-glutamate ligase